MALAALLALGASACSGNVVGKAPAATVDGTEISQAEVADLTAANIRFYQQAKELGQDTDGSITALGVDALGTGTDTQSMAESVASLDSLISSQLIHDELARVNKLPSKADRAAVRKSLESAVGGKDKLAKFDQEFIGLTIESRALTEAYRSYLAAQADKDLVALTPAERKAEMQKLFEQEKPRRPLCLNAVQSATEAEAAAVRARVDAGEDFVAVSKDVAPEGANIPDEGLIACLSFESATAAFGPELAKPKVGDVIGPVPYTSQQGGTTTYLVLRVDGLDGPTYEQMLPELEATIPEKPSATDPSTIDIPGAVTRLAAKADITINPMYGTWNERTSSIEAPVVPTEPGATVTTTIPVAAGS